MPSAVRTFSHLLSIWNTWATFWNKSLRDIAAKKIKTRLTSSPEGLEEIADMHHHLLDNLHLATSVFVMGGVQAARTLLAEKDRMRDLEQAATANHLRRLREGRTQSIKTSSLDIDTARDLKCLGRLSDSGAKWRLAPQPTA
jgi:phosphate:Na+ symporter